MARKKFPSDKTTKAMRVSNSVHIRVRRAAKKDGRTVRNCADGLLTFALDVKKI